MNNPLFDESDDNSEKGFELKTNQDYAKSYNHLRKKELLQKCKYINTNILRTAITVCNANIYKIIFQLIVKV